MVGLMTESFQIVFRVLEIGRLEANQGLVCLHTRQHQVQRCSPLCQRGSCKTNCAAITPQRLE
jgi:hypothetical protein